MYSHMETITSKDSIDRLPDELLISIVSRLPVIEAGKTSVLSRRWRYFWLFNSILDFDSLPVPFKSDREITSLETFDFLTVPFKSDREITSLETERRKFVRRVNRVLALHSGTTIEEFRISFDLDQSNANDINKWLKFAFQKRVKRLELNLVHSYTGLLDKEYILPHGISSCESLVKLSLIEVNVTEETLNFFISNCPFLEELCVRHSNLLKKLSISSTLIRLRHLDIATFPSCKSVEICAPNLLSFAFNGFNRIPIALKNVSSLISLSFGATCPGISINHINQISGCLSLLESLTFQTSLIKDCVLPRCPDLPRLKKLVLEIMKPTGFENLLPFTPLMSCAPLLRELVLKLEWSDFFLERTIAHVQGHNRPHLCLEVLQIQGFAGGAIDVELALYVIENAPSLKKMVIDFHRFKPDTFRKYENVMAELGEADVLDNDYSMAIARKGAALIKSQLDIDRMAIAREGVALIKSKLSAGVELIIR